MGGSVLERVGNDCVASYLVRITNVILQKSFSKFELIESFQVWSWVDFPVDLITSLSPQDATTLKPTYPRALSMTTGLAEKVTPSWRWLRDGELADGSRLFGNLAWK